MVHHYSSYHSGSPGHPRSIYIWYIHTFSFCLYNSYSGAVLLLSCNHILYSLFWVSEINSTFTFVNKKVRFYTCHLIGHFELASFVRNSNRTIVNRSRTIEKLGTFPGVLLSRQTVWRWRLIYHTGFVILSAHVSVEFLFKKLY